MYMLPIAGQTAGPIEIFCGQSWVAGCVIGLKNSIIFSIFFTKFFSHGQCRARQLVLNEVLIALL